MKLNLSKKMQASNEQHNCICSQHFGYIITKKEINANCAVDLLYKTIWKINNNQPRFFSIWKHQVTSRLWRLQFKQKESSNLVMWFTASKLKCVWQNLKVEKKKSAFKRDFQNQHYCGGRQIHSTMLLLNAVQTTSHSAAISNASVVITVGANHHKSSTVILNHKYKVELFMKGLNMCNVCSVKK